MKKLLTLLLVVISVQLFAQNSLITGITVNMPVNPDPNTANWGAGASVFTISAATTSRYLKEVLNSKMLLTIKKGGSKVCGSYTRETALASGFNTFNKVWSGRSAVSFLGQDCELTPGDYELCVQFFGAAMPPIPQSEEICKIFSIKAEEKQTYQGPESINPADGTEINARDANNPITFRWTPVVPKPGEDVIYTVKVIEIRQGQSASEAMKSAIPIFEKSVTNQNQLVGNSPNQLSISRGSKYGWFVQAMNREGSPYGRKNGMSEACVFWVGLQRVDSELAEIELISPKDSLTESKPTFKWRPQKKLPVDVTYRVRVLTMLENEKPEDVIKTSKPVLDVSGIKETTLRYPVETPPLDSGKLYVWTVDAMNPAGKIIAAGFTLVEWSMPCVCLWMYPGPQQNYEKCQSDPPFPISPPSSIFGSCPQGKQYAWFKDGVIIGAWSGNSSIMIDPSTLSAPGTYTYTWKAKSGNNIKCTYDFTVRIFPQLITEIHEWIPGVSGAIITEICKDYADATLYVRNLPPGYTVAWSWSDYPGGLSGTLASSNPSNDAPILPNCSPGMDYVIRTYQPIINGTPAWPASCLPSDVTLKIWCPSFAGTIQVSPATTFCSYGPENITLTLTGNIGNIITWSRNPGSITPTPGLNATTITDILPSPGVYTYTVTVQNGSSVASCSSATAHVTVTIQEPLTATITSISPFGTNPLWVCPNDAVKLQLNAQPPGTQILWEYSVDCSGVWIPAGTSMNQNTNQIGNLGPYNPSPTHSLCWRATVTPSGPICPSVISDIFEIDLYPPPCSPIISTNGSLPKCPGSSVLLSASTPSCGNPPFTFQWYLDGILLPGETGQQIDALLPGYYTVEVWADGHCISAIATPFKVTNCMMDPYIEGDCSSNGSTTITLTAYPNSYPNPSPQVSPPCNGPYTYTWTTGGTTIGNQQSINVTPTVTTIYCVEIVDGLGCHKSVCMIIKVCQVN